MTRNDIIRMAREANISVMENNTFADDMYISVLYRFAKLVAAHEREECAKACEARNTYQDPSGKTRVLRWEAQQCARAIRARGEDADAA